MAEAGAAALAEAAATALAAAEAALAAETTAAIDDLSVQRLLTAGIRLFARKTELERRHFAPVTGPEAVTPTEAATVAVELLRSVDINLFDLSMWAARPRFDEA